MKVIFLKSFLKDIRKINDKKLKKKLKDLIVILEKTETLEEVSGITKMKGYSIAYRIRVGDFRLGLYYENDAVELARFVKRNDIYQVFPD